MERDEKGQGSSTIERMFKNHGKSVRFTICRSDDNSEVLLKKFYDYYDEKGNRINTERLEVKHYNPDGVEDCEGTIFINDHSDPDRIYAFWRSKELQNLMDSKGIEKLSFRKDGDSTFDMTIEKSEGEGFTFETDGNVTTTDTGDKAIFGASYVYKNDTHELILIQGYNIEKLTVDLLK